MHGHVSGISRTGVQKEDICTYGAIATAKNASRLVAHSYPSSVLCQADIDGTEVMGTHFRTSALQTAEMQLQNWIAQTNLLQAHLPHTTDTSIRPSVSRIPPNAVLCGVWAVT
jgi:hypothetical protein